MLTKAKAGQSHSASRPAHALQAERVAFTGRFASMQRREAEALVRDHAGEPVSSVSARTTLLVVGAYGWPLQADGAVSAKLRAAEALQVEGRGPRIMPEAEFLELVGARPPEQPAAKTFTPDRVRDLIGLDDAALRRLELAGLVRSRDGLYDFQDIVSLQCLAPLLRAGVTHAVIHQSIDRLRRLLPGTDRPLAQLRLIADGAGALLAGIDGGLMAPDGQHHLRFDTPEQDVDAPLVLSPGPIRRGWSAEDWLDEGVALEDSGQFDAAAAAHRRALALQPGWAIAAFNLGNALRAGGRREAAEEMFLLAVELDPALAEAWYNLADLQEANGDIAAAAASLGKAIEAQPGFLDARDNLKRLRG